MRPSAVNRTVLSAAATLAAMAALALGGCTGAPDDSSASSAAPRVTATPGRTTAVPAPSGGTTHDVIEPGKPGPVTKVALDKPAELKGGVTVSIPQVISMTAKAKTPGEITGPAVAVHVLIRNGSTKPVDVDSTIVTLLDATGKPAQPTVSAPYKPLTGSIAAGKSGKGTYVFLIPKDDRHGLTLTVEYLAGAPIARFTGGIS